jgi:Flp pilus assembly protein TadD
MSQFSRILKVLPVGACILAVAACGKSQTQHSNIIPDEAPKLKAKALDPAAASLRMAENAYERGEYTMAAQFYYRAAELQPDNSAILVKLAYAMYKAGSPADAEKVFRASLEKDGAQPDALRGLAHSLVLQGRAAEALPIYRRALASGGRNDPRVYAGLGAALDMLGKHDEARATYEAGLKLAPDNPALRNNLALSFAMSGDPGKAKAMREDSVAPPKAKPAATKIGPQAAPPPPKAAPVRDVAEGATERAPAIARQPEPAARKAAAEAPPAQREPVVIPAPPRTIRMSLKAGADLPRVEGNDEVIYIRTGRASVVQAEPPSGNQLTVRFNATPEDAADEVLRLLAQAERGPRFVWQEAQRTE